MKIVGLSGSLRSPSRTATLARIILEKLSAHPGVQTHFIPVVDLAPHLFQTLDYDPLPAPVAEAYQHLYDADVILLASPVYKASYSGILKHFLDLIPPQNLKGKIGIVAATGGTERHALVLDHQLRPLLSFFGVQTLPTGIYLKDSDFIKVSEGTDYHLENADALERIQQIVSETLGVTRRRPIAAVA